MPQTTDDSPTLTAEDAAALRAPFEPNQIGKLPRVTCKECSDRRCQKHSKAKCDVCGNYISTAHLHLDFVGHAAVTDRLLKVDPHWTWAPLAVTDDGGPLIRTIGKEAELWISLTVKGVTRLGVGTAPAGSFDLPKQLISDAIRNAAMRFGVALDLWSKEVLSEGDEPAAPTADEHDAQDATTRAELMEAFNQLHSTYRTKVLDRLKRAGIIPRKSAGAIGTVDAQHFDTVRKTIQLAHTAATGETEEKQEKVGPESYLAGIEHYRSQLDEAERALWIGWLAENHKGKSLESLTLAQLEAAFEAIGEIAAGHAEAT